MKINETTNNAVSIDRFNEALESVDTAYAEGVYMWKHGDLPGAVRHCRRAYKKAYEKTGMLAYT